MCTILYIHVYTYIHVHVYVGTYLHVTLYLISYLNHWVMHFYTNRLSGVDHVFTGHVATSKGRRDYRRHQLSVTAEVAESVEIFIYIVRYT